MRCVALLRAVNVGGRDRRTAFVTLSGSGRLIAIDDWPVPGLRLNCEA